MKYRISILTDPKLQMYCRTYIDANNENEIYKKALVKHDEINKHPHLPKVIMIESLERRVEDNIDGWSVK